MASEGTQRRLAAIMFTDIVGYTALMARDEQADFSAAGGDSSGLCCTSGDSVDSPGPGDDGTRSAGEEEKMRASSVFSSRWASVFLLTGLLGGGQSLAGDEVALSPHLASVARAEALANVQAEPGVSFVDLYAEW